jgi:hypothetical protein
MTEPQRATLTSRPTSEQLERFSKLSYEERFHWLVDMLALCYELSSREAQDSWRKHKDRQEAKKRE